MQLARLRQEYNKNPIYRVLYLFIGFYRFVRTREDLILAVEILNYLEDSLIVGWPQYLSPLNPPYSKPMNAEPKSYLTSKNGKVDLDKIQNYALRNGIPYWNIDVSVYGCKACVMQT